MGDGDGIGRRSLLGGALSATAASAALAACGGPGAAPPRPAEPTQAGTLLPRPGQTPAGDPDWRLTSAGPPNAIEGYTDKVSVRPGEQVGLYASTTGTSFTVRAYRVGWYGGAQAALVWQSGPVPGRAQAAPQYAAPTRTVSAAWEQSLSFSTTGWPEGAYLLRMDADNGHQRYIPFVVRSATAAGKVLLMHAPATWQAYNTWNGYDLYQGPDGNYGTRSYVVSFDRPYDDVGAVKFLTYERAVVVLAERLGLPLAYTTGLDVHADRSVLDGASAIVSLGHDEYWTPEQRQYVTAARDAGTNLAFLGANTCFRRIQFRDTPLGTNRAVACYKSSYTKDPLYPAQPDLVTTDFRVAPGADPESSMTGVLYEGYPVDAPYVVYSPDHWLFAGTGVTRGESFAHLVGVEYDRVTPSAPTPRPIQILAHSPLVCDKTHSFSDSAYYTVPGGAGVFASGTMRWVEGLMAGTRDDGGDHAMDARTGAFVTQVTENLLKAFAVGPAGKNQPVPADNVQEVYL
ncbi:MAG TPA: N,N-dimethylformamidase beta subunit family domain-containing protein [Actinocrinis sp.]|nr:N,N-dimethylformamidase beta subunit family domain-containing protein [Actinocrinis sp.]